MPRIVSVDALGMGNAFDLGTLQRHATDAVERALPALVRTGVFQWVGAGRKVSGFSLTDAPNPLPEMQDRRGHA